MTNEQKEQFVENAFANYRSKVLMELQNAAEKNKQKFGQIMTQPNLAFAESTSAADEFRFYQRLEKWLNQHLDGKND